MAGSRFAYVRSFELPDPVLPGVFMVVRIDGKGFHGFSHAHGFEKPNDPVALELMNHAARHVCQELRGDVTLAFGESDEYSFLLKKSCKLYNRRESKIVTHIVSLFTSAYVYYWPQLFPNKPLQCPPSFDGRLVAYPGVQEVRDYFAWRQADTHINNLYNTTFWSLVLLSTPPLTERQAHETLKGTVSAQKNEILFSRFGINYERLPAMFRKGTTIVWTEVEGGEEVEGEEEGRGSTGNGEGADAANGTEAGSSNPRAHAQAQAQSQPQLQPTTSAPGKPKKSKRRKAPPRELRTLHVDIIGRAFWEEAGSKAPAAAIVEEGGQGRSKFRGPDKESNGAGDGSGVGNGAERGTGPGLDAPAPAPASIQSLAPPPPLPPWESPDRTQGTAGLGRWALRD